MTNDSIAQAGGHWINEGIGRRTRRRTIVSNVPWQFIAVPCFLSSEISFENYKSRIQKRFFVLHVNKRVLEKLSLQCNASTDINVLDNAMYQPISKEFFTFLIEYHCIT